MTLWGYDRYRGTVVEYNRGLEEMTIKFEDGTQETSPPLPNLPACLAIPPGLSPGLLYAYIWPYNPPGLSPGLAP
jgi:hypothetical protein